MRISIQFLFWRDFVIHKNSEAGEIESARSRITISFK